MAEYNIESRTELPRQITEVYDLLFHVSMYSYGRHLFPELRLEAFPSTSLRAGEGIQQVFAGYPPFRSGPATNSVS